MAETLSPALRAVSDAVLAVASQQSVEDVLQQLVHRARELAGARYAALGTPDGDGGFTRFLVSGMSDELISKLGPLPRQHGMLGAMLETAEPAIYPDIHDHPRFRGWWPSAHPDMRSFLGVPIVAPEGVIGAFYLTDKEGAADFAVADREVIELLAAHAAIAITNARPLRAQPRAVDPRRAQPARARAPRRRQPEAVLARADRRGGRTRSSAATTRRRARHVTRLQSLAREALEELRSLILELRPPELERDGLCGALRKHVEAVRRLHRIEVDLDIDDAIPGDGRRDREVLRIAQEALQNAVRHSGAARVGVRLARADDGGLSLEVTDDGAGFDPADPALRSRRLGLTSMEERAQRIGARLEVRSAPGEGTTVRLEA